MIQITDALQEFSKLSSTMPMRSSIYNPAFLKPTSLKPTARSPSSYTPIRPKTLELPMPSTVSKRPMERF
jgi:hypothetical protein